MNSFDVVLYHFVNNLSGHVAILDAIMIVLAKDAPFLYAALFIVAWFTLPREDSKIRHGLIVSVLAGILALVVNVVISHIWFRPRPFAVLPNGTFHQLIAHSNDASFPSDHASGSFAFAFGVYRRGPIWIRRSFMALAILVAIARVYVGLHWPTDVVAGVVVGLFSSMIAWRFEKYVRWITKIGLRLFRYGGRQTDTVRDV
ncbi:undecaprenyl-diphosphatase [Alicyclobacillus sp. SP_1]|uniref:undecaprenyl-diphosphatase n=1 Tax=Alicyclobacillus sp. SP_1 TaxID=2942475 RepID=UPI002157ACB7|nr:undecaprenyl-diphosphatase [Alicyclobacillus sp. SP_1]